MVRRPERGAELANQTQKTAGKERPDFVWHAFPNEARFGVLGLYWHRDNQPLLWRLPKVGFDIFPKGVAQQAKMPSGGRIFMRCNTTRLGLRALAENRGNGRGLDVYVNGRFYKSIVAEAPGVDTELVFFDGFDRREKEILIYLPYRQEILVKAVGVDEGAAFQTPETRFNRPLPIVFYGSSICQGSGASKPGMTYGAIVARELGVDFVNLGFGGAGKAEPEVVDLVKAIPGCCYVFDLGKSYGMQDRQPFEAMLRAIGEAHPDASMVCITPITSALEVHSASYQAQSVHTRNVMGEAAEEAMSSGVPNIHLIDGVTLFGFEEHDGLSGDGLHPSDYGYARIAGRLLPLLRQVLGL